MKRYILTLALAATFLLAGTAAQAGSNPGQGMTFQVYAATTDVPSGPPQIGQWDEIGWDIYELSGTAEEPVPVGDSIGRMIGACILITTTEGHCVGSLELYGIGTLMLSLKVRAAGGSSIAVTGGTGEFAGAHGVMTHPRVPGHGNDRLVTVELAGFNTP